MRSRSLRPHILLFILFTCSAWLGQTLGANPPTTATVVEHDLVWGRFEIGAGGHIDQVVVHPSVKGLVYARSDVGGVFRRDPGSKQFVNLLDNLDHDLLANHNNQNLLGADGIAVSKQDVDVVFAYLGRYTTIPGPAGLFRSADRGNTWQMVLKTPGGSNMTARDQSSCIAVDPVDGDYVYFGSRKHGLFRSTDAGLTWKKVADVSVGWGSGKGREAHIGIRHVLIDPTGTHEGRSKSIYVCPAREGIWRSNDGGETWQPLENSPKTVDDWSFDGDGRVLYISAENVGPRKDAILAFDTETDTFTDITPVAQSKGKDGKPSEKFGGIGFETATGTKARPVTKSGKQRGGKPWRQRSVYEVLINRRYIGQIVHKGKAYPGEHEAIVPTEQFERVQKQLSANKTYTHMHQVKRFVLLRRMIRCGHCGGRVQPTWTRKHGREYRYYACTKKVKEGYGQCPLPNLPAGQIETAVVDQLRALLRHPHVIARTYREISKASGTGPDPAELAKLDELRMRREQTRKSIRAVLNVADQDEGFMADELKRLSAELKSLDKTIGDLESKATKGSPVELDRVSEALRAIDPIWDVLFPEEQRRIAQLLVEDITVSTNGIDIRFRANGIEQIVEELQPIEERHA
jgi:hypothetical protein